MEFKKNSLKGCGMCQCPSCISGYKTPRDAMIGMMGSGLLTSKDMMYILKKDKMMGGNIFDDIANVFPDLVSKVPIMGPAMSWATGKTLDLLDPYRKNPRNPVYTDPALREYTPIASKANLGNRNIPMPKHGGARPDPKDKKAFMAWVRSHKKA
jgi:hypothetical protein